MQPLPSKNSHGSKPEPTSEIAAKASAPLHVLLIARSFEADGPGKVILGCLDRWDPAVVRCSLLALGENGLLRGAFELRIKTLGGSVSIAKASPLDAERTAASLASNWPFGSVDVLAAHLLTPAAVGAGLARRMNVPLVVVDHGVHAWNDKGRLLRPFVRAWYRRNLRSASGVVAVSPKNRTELIAEGIPAHLVKLVCNGVVEAQPMDPTTARTSLFDLCGMMLPEELPVIGVVGALEPWKRPEIALSAAHQAPGNLAVAFCGEGSLRQKLSSELAPKLGVPTFLTGHIGDVGPFYRSIDVLLHPSRQESFGMAPLEGLAAGLPVIASAESGLADLLPPAPLAWLVGSEDPTAWAGALVDALTRGRSPELAAVRSAWVAARYSADLMAAGHLSLLRELARLK